MSGGPGKLKSIAPLHQASMLFFCWSSAAFYLCLSVTATQAQNGYSVSDYKPHTLNDDYKPGQGIIFHNSGASSVVSPSPYHAPPSNNQPVYRPAYQTTPVSTVSSGKSFSSLSSPQSHTKSAPSHRAHTLPKDVPSAKEKASRESESESKSDSGASSNNAMLPTKGSGKESVKEGGKESVKEGGKESVKEGGKESVKEGGKESVKDNSAEKAKPTDAPAKPVKESPKPPPTPPSPSAAVTVTTPSAKSQNAGGEEKPLPAKFLAPHPLTMPETIAGLAGLLLYCLSIFGTIYLLKRTKEEVEEYVDSIKPLHSVLLRRSPGPHAPPYVPGAMRLAVADGAISSRDRFRPVVKKSKSTIEANLAALKTKLDETIVPEIVGTERPVKNPWIALALSVFPGAGQIYIGQRKRGILLLVAALFINPLAVAFLTIAGVFFLCAFCMRMHIVISQDVAHLLNSVFRSRLNIFITGGLLFLFLLGPAAYDAYSSARRPKAKKAGERSLFDITAVAVLCTLLVFVALFIIAIVAAPPSSTGALVKTTYIELELHDPESSTSPEKATESKPTSNNQVKPSLSKMNSVIVSAARPVAAPKVGAESQATKPDDVSQDIQPKSDNVENDAVPLKTAPTGEETPAQHLHSPLGDSVKRADTAAGAVQPPSISNKDERGEDKEKVKEASQNPNQKVLDLPAVDSLPETASKSDAQKELDEAKKALDKNDLLAAYKSAQEAVKADARSAMAYRLKAIIEERLSMPNRAMDDSSKALALDSKDSEMFLLRSRVLSYLLSDYASSVVSANQALALTPEPAEAYAARGTARLKLDDLTGAQEDLFAALKIKSECPAAIVLQANILGYFGETTGALADAEWATELDPKMARAWCARARYRLDADPQTCIGMDGKEALGFVEKALMLEPRNPEAHCLWAESALAGVIEGKISDGSDAIYKADDHLVRSLEVLPTAEGYYMRALINRALGAPHMAGEYWKEVLVLEPNTIRTEPFSAIKQMYNTKDAAVKNVEFYTRAIAAKPNVATNYWNRCNAYETLEEHDKAYADITSYIALLPNAPDGYELRCSVDRRSHRDKQAQADAYARYKLEKDPKTTTGQASDSAQVCGMLFFVAKDYSSALMYFAEAIDLGRGHLDAMNGAGLYADLGQTYFNLGDYNKALGAAKMARNFDPSNPLGCVNEGEALYMLGQAAPAEGPLKAGSDIFEKQNDKLNLGEAQYYLGLVHKALKRDDEATKEFARAKELGYTPPQ